MNAPLLALAGTALLLAPLALTSGPQERGDPGAEAPWQVREPCKYGALPGAAGQVLLSEGFEAGMGAWTKYSAVSRPNLWHWSTFAGNNSAMDALGHGGPGRLYYGIENALGGTFNTDPVENRGEARSPPIAVPVGTVAMALNTKWHVEWDRPTHYDAIEFGYVNAAGQTVLLCYFGPWLGDRNLDNQLWAPGIGYYANSPSGGLLITGCKPYRNHYPICNDSDPTVAEATHFDLAPYTNLWEARWFPLPASLAGQTVRLTFAFKEGDALINDATGWMIDDVQLVKLG